jgi:hypothetical protein
MTGKDRASGLFNALRPWTYSELSESFSRLARLQSFSVRFCFFVDGLDEYNGDHEDLIELLQHMARSSIIKLCVASRPWNFFQDAFGGMLTHRLKLEDLTRKDIWRFTEDRLCQNKHFRALQQREPRCQELINEIRDSAQGVFLWVFLIVRFLLRGLSNADRISELQKRLRMLPSDLGKLLRHILDTTDEVYHEHQARLFITAGHTHAPLSLMTYSYIDEDNPSFAQQLPIAALTISDNLDWLRHMRIRVNAHCNGLLECMSASADWQLLIGDAEASSVKRSISPVMLSKGFRVTFLHRSVRDFIATKEIDDLLNSRSPEILQPSMQICFALLAELKTVHFTLPDEQLKVILGELTGNLGFYAHEAYVHHEVNLDDILDTVETIFAKITPDTARHVVMIQHRDTQEIGWAALRDYSSLEKNQEELRTNQPQPTPAQDYD